MQILALQSFRKRGSERRAARWRDPTPPKLNDNIEEMGGVLL
jgi:hypothetical protein